MKFEKIGRQGLIADCRAEAGNPMLLDYVAAGKKLATLAGFTHRCQPYKHIRVRAHHMLNLSYNIQSFPAQEVSKWKMSGGTLGCLFDRCAGVVQSNTVITFAAF